MDRIVPTPENIYSRLVPFDYQPGSKCLIIKNSDGTLINVEGRGLQNEDILTGEGTIPRISMMI